MELKTDASENRCSLCGRRTMALPGVGGTDSTKASSPRTVRVPRQRRGEEQTFLGQAVEGGREIFRVAESLHEIGAHALQGDQHHIRTQFRSWIRPDRQFMGSALNGSPPVSSISCRNRAYTASSGRVR